VSTLDDQPHSGVWTRGSFPPMPKMKRILNELMA
jgi:hypothetical protein